jgi:hypothetical protein
MAMVMRVQVGVGLCPVGGICSRRARPDGFLKKMVRSTWARDHRKLVVRKYFRSQENIVSGSRLPKDDRYTSNRTVQGLPILDVCRTGTSRGFLSHLCCAEG